jgi:hypothetical protein
MLVACFNDDCCGLALVKQQSSTFKSLNK